MKKKVCFVMTDAFSFNVLCRGQLEFLKQNYDVDVTLVAGGGESQYKQLEERCVGRVVRVPMHRKPNMLGDILSLVGLLRFFSFNRFDVVVYSTPKAMLLSSVACFVTMQKKRVCLIRGRAYESCSGLRRKIFLFFDFISIKLSSSVLSISNSLSSAYADDGLKTHSIVVLGKGSSNGVDIEKFHPCSLPSSAFEKKAFQVGVVGRVCVDKGILELDEVIRRVKQIRPDINFSIVGRIEDKEAERLVGNLVKDELVDYLDHKDKIESFLQKLDLHLFLTHREGFGNVALEAAACAVPTYAYDTVGVRDSVCNNVSGKLFPFGDIENLVEHIVFSADYPGLFKNSFKGSRDWAVTGFDSRLVWRRYFEFLLS